MKKKLPMRTLLVAGLGGVLALGVLAIVTVTGWEYSNSNHFCSTACHEVHPEEPFAHEQSHHAQVDCVECHIGRISTLEAVVKKSGHVVHAWGYFVGYERPLYSASFSGSARSCEGCHTAEPHRHNIIKAHKRFASDRNNTEKKLTLTMRMHAREFGDEDRRDIDWHASGAVRFISDDPQDQQIRWVEVAQPDGTKQIYNNVTAPLADAEIDAADIRTMDCADCHNRAGHPFPNPEEELDEALANGRLSTDLPYVKARLMALLEAEYASEDEARTLVKKAWDDYAAEFPELKEQEPEAWNAAREFTEERQEFMTNLMVRSRFVDAEDVSWSSFPDQNGHKQDPGCFRCHGGRLQTVEGTPITVNCTNCHSVPLVTKRNRVPSYFLSLIDMPKPNNHTDPAFISKHFDLIDEQCAACHESTNFGMNDRSYCSNSGCHGEVWEYLDLDALRTAAAVIKAAQPETSGQE